MSIIASSNFFTARQSRSQYQIERSLRFNSADSASLSRTLSVSGNRRTFTFSMWVKTAVAGGFIFGAGNNLNTGEVVNSCAFSDNTLQFRHDNQNQSTPTSVNTTAVFRDPTAWYHVIVAIDTTLATSTDRVKAYVNGVQQTLSGTFPSQNWDYVINSSSYTQRIGAGPSSGWGYYNGYMTEIHFVDGQQLTASSFGETNPATGVWQPKKYAGTYGTNGFYLKFADNSGTTSTTLGKDSSGNGNNWTPNNFSVTAGAGNDSLIDTPTPYADGGNGRGNYCTWNPLAVNPAACTFANGNLDVTTAGVGGNAFGTFAIPTSGKWYWEVVCTTGNSPLIGIAAYSSSTTYGYQNTNAVGYYSSGQKYVDAVASTYGSSYTTQTIGVAADADAGTITFYRDNVSQGSITHAVAELFPTVSDGASALNDTFVANFGQRAFAYTPPSGFKALNTQNLPEPTIKKPSSYMDVVTYTGTGSALTPTSSLGFSPDLVWIKGRSGATDNTLYDAVRDTEKRLESNNTDAEVTSDGGLTAFNSNGFTLGTLAQVNTSAATYCAWCWDESATPGFDIVTYTGNGTNRTIAHSLGVEPSMLIVKRRDTTGNWATWHTSIANTNYLLLNSTAASASGTTYWNSTSPTSSVFSVGTATDTNANTGTYVAYLWSEVAGFSKFGSYTGNGSSDGPFCFCGFRPRWVMIKRTDSAGSWYVIDTARATYNVANPYLLANASNTEATDLSWDILSNGFKLRSSYTDINVSSGSFVFAAFAESPFKYSLAR